eukprot:25500-Pyramimonas_sp.AAC.1
MAGGRCSKGGARLSSAHIRLHTLQELHGRRAAPFQMWLSPVRCALILTVYISMDDIPGRCSGTVWGGQGAA